MTEKTAAAAQECQYILNRVILAGRLELHFLPPYAPDLNPDEFVWNHMKNNGVSKKPLKKNESLRERVEQDLAAIYNNKVLVASFFSAKSVA